MALCLPFVENFDVDVPKCLLAAVKVLALCQHTLKLDVVIIVDLLPNCLHLDVGMEAKDAPNTVLPLEVDLQEQSNVDP